MLVATTLAELFETLPAGRAQIQSTITQYWRIQLDPKDSGRSTGYCADKELAEEYLRLRGVSAPPVLVFVCEIEVKTEKVFVVLSDPSGTLEFGPMDITIQCILGNSAHSQH
jgi:hypothetical protein